MDTNQPPSASPAPTRGGFWSRNSKVIVRLVIVVMIIAAAYFYSRNTDVAPGDENAAVEEQPVNETQPSLSVTDQSNRATPEVKAGLKESTETISVGGGRITVTTLSGNGYTHLARWALAEYLKNPSSDPPVVIAEQKIFIEDYLQKRLTDKKPLYAGDRVSFSEDLIQEVVNAAQKLSGGQIKNLSRYVPLVPDL